MSDNKEETYRLTPKGFLYMKLARTGVDADSLWEDFADFISRQAQINGYVTGTAALGFDGCGECITCTQK